MPGRRPARIPSGPPVTACSASLSVTMLMMTSAVSVTCRGVSHQRGRSISGSALALVRFVPYTRLPWDSSRPAIWPPIAHSPTTPITGLLGFCSSSGLLMTPPRPNTKTILTVSVCPDGERCQGLNPDAKRNLRHRVTRLCRYDTHRIVSICLVRILKIAPPLQVTNRPARRRHGRAVPGRRLRTGRGRSVRHWAAAPDVDCATQREPRPPLETGGGQRRSGRWPTPTW